MWGIKRLIAAGVALFLLGLIVFFPARVAYRWFAPDAVTLSGISGTVWHGAAVEGRAAGFYLANIHWDFRPLALFTGKAAYAVEGDPVAGFIETVVAIRPGGSLHFSDLAAALTVASLEDALPLLTGIDGRISLEFASLVLKDGFPVAAEGTAAIADLGIRGLSQAPLGAYRVVFRTADDVIDGEVEDVSGVLDIAGTIELRPDRSYTLSGELAATAAAPDALVRQLRYLGSPTAGGRRPFRFEGRL